MLGNACDITLISRPNRTKIAASLQVQVALQAQQNSQRELEQITLKIASETSH